MAGRQDSSRLSWIVAVLAAVFLALHLPYLPSSLEDLDSINFALGVHRFDVVHHRPHPPGYPVFILIAKVSRSLIDSDAKALSALSLVAGTLGIIAAAVLYRRLGERSGSDSTTVTVVTTAATALALTSPLYWFTAERPLSDMTGLAAALAVQAFIVAAETGQELAVAGLSAGLAAGIRSQVAWLTVPLLIVKAAGDPPRTARRWTAALAAFAVGVLVWLVPLIILTGGPAAYWHTLSEQGADDLGGVVMLWTTPTPRELVEAAYYMFVAPWVTWPTALAVLGLAIIGVRLLRRRGGRGLLLILVAFVPYLVFDVLFQETFTSRYALPIVIPIAFLAANGLRILPIYPALLITAGLVMFDAHVGGRSIAEYSRRPAPAFRLLDDMKLAEQSAAVLPVLAPDRRQTLDLRPPLIWLAGEAPSFERQLTAPPQHEWLEAVRYWNEGGRAPVWFVVDPRRTSIALIHHGEPAPYRWSTPYPVLLSGTRPDDADWVRVDRPDWYLGEGWALTPETAGVAAVDRRGLEYGRIEGWVNRAVLDGGGLVVGGRNFDPVERPQLTISAGDLPPRTIRVQPGPFLDVTRLPAFELGGSIPEYVRVTVSAARPARVAIEQFDASRSRGVLGFGDGWFEPELNPATGQRWRWLGGRGELRYLTRDESGATLHLEGESPRRYYPRDSRIIVSAEVPAGAGASASAVRVVLRDVTVADDFSLDVRVPGSRQPSTIVVETDQTHVPSETSWRSTLDRRRLGLRIFKCELRP